jgi:hypothetical protein
VWHTPAIPALVREGQKNGEFKTSLSDIMRPCSKNIHNKISRRKEIIKIRAEINEIQTEN